MNRKVSLCAAAVATGLLASHLSADELTWKGGTFPLKSDNYVTSSGTPLPTGAEPASGDYLNIGAGGTANHTGVNYNIPGRIRVGHRFSLVPGLEGDGTITQTGNSIVLGGNSSGTEFVGLRAGLVIGYNANGTVNQNAGVINVRENVIIGCDDPNDTIPNTGGSGTLNVRSGTFRSQNNDMVLGLGLPGTVYLTAGGSMEVYSLNSGNDRTPDLIVGANTASTFTKDGGGNLFVANDILIGSGSTMTLAAGKITTKHEATAPTGNFVVGRNGSAGDSLNISWNGAPAIPSGPTLVTVGNRFLLASGGGGATNSIVNQSVAETGVTIARNLVVSDTGNTSSATYNLINGTLTANADLSRIGRRGDGKMVQTGGTATFNAGLAVGDDDSTAAGETDNATGLYEISGGSLVTNPGTGAALRVGSAGNGTLRVIGDDGIVDVNGDFLLGNTSDGVGKLDYRFEAGDSLSQIDVSGTATLAAGTLLTLDSSSAAPTQPTYNLLTAPDVADNGLIVPMLGWTHQVVAGGSGEILQAVQTTARFWDTDGATPGSGGASPSGNWDGATANFTTDAAGASAATSAATTLTDDVIFAAGGDGTGTYTVNVSGTQTAHAVQVARGDVMLTGGTLAVGVFDVVAGASGTVASTVSGGGASGSVTKIGAGTLTLTANNTYTGGTNVQAGTLRVNRLHENNAVNITGGKLQVMDSSPTLPAHPSGDNAFVSRPSSLAIANNGAALGSRTYSGQLDLGNNDLILDYDGASTLAEIEDMVRAGYNGGDWLGNGITSSTANANRNFALGVADNANLAIPFDGTRLFSGQVVDATTILVKFTHRIDLDLDGVITTNDATIFNSRYSEGAPAYWSIGDLDYDKVFTTNDATLFNSFYNEALASVPEPATLGVLAVGGLGVLGRRRRRSC